MIYSHCDDPQAELERCDREIEEMLNQPEEKEAWLVTLGIEDWEAERRLILQGVR